MTKLFHFNAQLSTKHALLALLFFPTIMYSQWFQKGMDIDGEGFSNMFGWWSVSTSGDGNSVAIGVPENDGIGTDAGHTRVYEFNGTDWVQKGADIDGEQNGDLCGFSVSLNLDGNTVAIGAPENNGTGTDAGHVRIFEWDGVSSWIQKGADIEGEAANDESGYSVSLSPDGHTVVIGARYNNDGGADAGQVRVFEWDGVSNWVQKGGDIDGEAVGDRSGTSVSISDNGNTIVIGAPNNGGTAVDAGHARIYEWDGISSWIQKGADIDGEGMDDHSGMSVSLSSDGNAVSVGAPENNGSGPGSGHSRVYEWTGSAWIQKGIDLDGEADYDFSGHSTSLSADGNTVAIGAYYNDGSANNSGHVKIYTWNGSAWIQKGSDVDGEAANDYSGYSVSLSDDGNTLAAGSSHNDGNGNNAGHTRLFYFCTPAESPTLTSTNQTHSCPGENVNIDISGNLNFSTEWGIYTNSCGGTAEGTTATTSFSVSPSSTTTYYVQGEGMCSSTGPCDSITITVTSDVTDPIISNCPTDIIVDADQSGCSAMVSWTEPTATDDCLGVPALSSSHSSGSAFNHGTTTVTYTATDAAGNTSQCTFEITVNSPVNLSSTTTDEITGNDGTIDLVVSGGATPYTYDWDNDGTGDNDDTEDLSLLAGGDYTVLVTDANGCMDSTTVIVDSQLGSVGTDELDIRVYPNPSTGIFYIEHDLNEILELEVYDLLNKKVKVQTILNPQSAIDLQELSDGIYIIRIFGPELDQTIRLIKT